MAKAAEARPVPDSEPDSPERPRTRWIKRLGVAGFAFFLIKGLLWLIIPALLAYLGMR